MGCKSKTEKETENKEEIAKVFQLKQSDETIQVFVKGGNLALVTQNAKPDFRPYIHPILAPETEVALTQYSPGHHPHQTGLYWGFTRVNGSGATQEELKKWFYNRDKPEDIQKKIGRDFSITPAVIIGKRYRPKY